MTSVQWNICFYSLTWWCSCQRSPVWADSSSDRPQRRFWSLACWRGHLASLKRPCLQALLVLFYELSKNVLSAWMYIHVYELPPTFTETSWAATLLFTKLTGQHVSSGAIKGICVPSSFLHQLRVLPSFLDKTVRDSEKS